MPVEKNLPADDSGFLIEQLRQSLGLLRVAFDSTGEAMLIIDESRVVRWANQQAADLWGRGITVRGAPGWITNLRRGVGHVVPARLRCQALPNTGLGEILRNFYILPCIVS